MSLLSGLNNIFSSGDYFFRPKKEVSINSIVETIYENGSMEDGPWIAGGMGRCIAVDDWNFNDIDIWFKNQRQLDRVKTNLDRTFGWEMYKSFDSDNAETYRIGNYSVQLIKRNYYNSILDVFNDFDFTCCQIFVDKDLKISGPGIKDAMNYKLKVNRLDQNGFLARYAKYVGYGYVMNPDDFVNIIEHEELNYEFDGTTIGY